MPTSMEYNMDYARKTQYITTTSDYLIGTVTDSGSKDTGELTIITVSDQIPKATKYLLKIKESVNIKTTFTFSQASSNDKVTTYYKLYINNSLVTSDSVVATTDSTTSTGNINKETIMIVDDTIVEIKITGQVVLTTLSDGTESQVGKGYIVNGSYIDVTIIPLSGNYHDLSG